MQHLARPFQRGTLSVSSSSPYRPFHTRPFRAWNAERFRPLSFAQHRKTSAVPWNAFLERRGVFRPSVHRSVPPLFLIAERGTANPNYKRLPCSDHLSRGGAAKARYAVQARAYRFDLFGFGMPGQITSNRNDCNRRFARRALAEAQPKGGSAAVQRRWAEVGLGRSLNFPDAGKISLGYQRLFGALDCFVDRSRASASSVGMRMLADIAGKGVAK